MKKKLSTQVKNHVIRVLRKDSLRWWAKHEAYKRAFIRKEGRSHIYECACCKGEFRRKEMQADHIDPVVDPLAEDFTLDEYAMRLYVLPEGYQILCIPCHDKKTEEENSLRRTPLKRVKITKKKKKKRKKKNAKTAKRTTKKSKKSRLGRSTSS